MDYPIWFKRLLRLAGAVACTYFAGVLLFGPPYLARKHTFTWELNFQQRVEQLAARMSSEEEFINALRVSGFEIWIRPENPITFKDNGNRSISYKDENRSYNSYEDFVRSHDLFQAAFPDDEPEHPRVADRGYGFVACRHSYKVTWQLRDEKIVGIKANDGWACL